MNDKIANSIALHQATINELKDIKKKVENNIDDKVKFRIETRQIFRIWEPYITKCRDKMDIGPHTMLTILDQAIQVERDRINKLIDMEIDNRINNKKK
jgi:hypothetical protein